MKITVVAAIASVAAILVGHHIMYKSLRRFKTEGEMYAQIRRQNSAFDQASAVIADMMAEGLYEDRTDEEIARDFESLVLLYAAK